MTTGPSVDVDLRPSWCDPSHHRPAHHDPRAGFGYVPDPAHLLGRLVDAVQAARYAADVAATNVADSVADGYRGPVFGEFVVRYARERAGLAYAQAVRDSLAVAS